jgi:hypothetical protein
MKQQQHKLEKCKAVCVCCNEISMQLNISLSLLLNYGENRGKILAHKLKKGKKK